MITYQSSYMALHSEDDYSISYCMVPSFVAL